MRLRGLLCFLVIAGVAGLGGQAWSQSKQKTIGQPSGGGMTPTLVVVNADGAKLEGNKLTLTGVQKSSIIFADRPERIEKVEDETAATFAAPERVAQQRAHFAWKRIFDENDYPYSLIPLIQRWAPGRRILDLGC